MSKISGPHDTETPCPDEGPAPDTGAAALALMLRVLGLAAEPDQLLHESGTSRLGETDIVRLARRRPVKARAVAIAAGRLARAPLPAIAAARDGTFFILARIAGDEALIQHPLVGRPQIIPLLELEQLWSGRLILMTRRAPLSDLARRFDITWFLSAIGKYRRLLIEVLAASLVLQLLALVSPLFFQVVVDKVLVHRTLSTLDVLMIALVAVALFEAVLGGLRTHIFTHTSSRIDVELGARLFRHLISLPLAYFEARRTGDSVARVRELESIRSFLTSSALTVVIDLGFTLVFVAVMAVYSMPLTLVVLAAVPVYVAISLVVTPLFKARLDDKFARGAESQAFLVEAVNGIETLKAQAVEPQMQHRWEEQLAGYVASSFRVLKLSNIGAESVQLVNKLATAAVLYLGAGEVMDGALTVGELVAFNMLAGRVTQPVLRLAQLWQEFQHTRISIERLGDILNTPAEPEAAGAAAMPPMRGAITFEGVGFRYHPDAPLALDGIDLTIAAGDVIGIVGASGSGKSTLAKLVQRLYVPERGRVMVDGLDVALADTAWLRRQIGVVLQDSVLFNRSIRDNIALADPAMPMARVIDAAGLAGAHDFITALPQGYATAIGERGVGLSGGQRQRIAIARALVTGPRLLILDEATSALDYESEAIVQHNMARIAAGRTVLIIAHRLTAVRNCHRIVVLDKGRIAESGTHAELLAGGGRYAGLWRLQAGGHD